MDIKKTINSLKEASDLYYNEGESFMTDAEFDQLESDLKTEVPNHPYFDVVGSEERGGKIKLPIKMGSLDQLQEGDVEQWVSKHNLNKEKIIVTEKLDGTSVLLDYNESGHLQSAYSRGNGTEGADITRHIKRIKNVPQKISGPMFVRCESILPIKDWDRVNSEMKDITGNTYKNARNWGAGQMNSKQAASPFYENIKIIAYSIEKDRSNKDVQLTTLKEEGFLTVEYNILKGSELTDPILSQAIKTIKSVGKYEIDGVVLDVNSNQKRETMSGKTSSINPGFAKKYKVGGKRAIATVVEVEWKASKHGFLKPRIKIKPVNLVGATITFCSGFNPKFIKENGVGPGATFTLVRSGDVIPFYKECLSKVDPQMPEGFGELEWTEGNVDLVMKVFDDRVYFQQLIAGFSKLQVDSAGEGNLRKIYDSGYKDLARCIRLDQATWQSIVGQSAGSKIFTSLHSRLNPVKLAALAASTNLYDRGIGERKLQPVIDFFGGLPTDLEESSYMQVDGVAGTTGQKIVEGNVLFAEFLNEINGLYTLTSATKRIETGSLTGEYYVLTGIRDSDLQVAIEAQGGIVGSSMSKCTCLIAKDPNSTSGKAKKAKEKGIAIIGIEEAKQLVK